MTGRTRRGHYQPIAPLGHERRGGRQGSVLAGGGAAAPRNYWCPYCTTSTLEGKGAGRGRKRCTECGATFGIPKRRRVRIAAT